MADADGLPGDEAVAAFARDGAICLRGAIPPDWLAVLEAGLDRNIREPGPYRRHYTKEGAPGAFFGDYCNWRRIPEYERFVYGSPAAAVARRLMGSGKAVFFHEHVLVKEPGTLDPTPWHHDQPYYCVDGAQTCSLWIPLDPVDRATSVEFVAGSHRWGRWFRPRRFTNVDYTDVDPRFEDLPDIEAERDRHRMLGWDLEPGDCIAFHFLTVHGAPGNASPARRRRAVALRFVGDDARFVRRPGMLSPPFPEVTLVDGAPLESEFFPAIPC